MPADTDTALLLFFRRPRHGEGKRRIAATLGEERAQELAVRLLDCALEDLAAWNGPVLLSPSREADAPWARELMPRACVLPQPDGNLGERIHAVHRESARLGYRRVLFIGSDAPLLDERYYAQALLALDGADVVLGPAADGGVTLMGSSTPWPPMADLPWGEATLGRALAERCRSAGLRTAALPPQADVDRAEDLPALRDALRDDARPGRRALYRWLSARGILVA